LIALLVSAFLTGLAGGAFAYYHVSYYYQFTFTPIWSFDTLTMVYIGGQGTILGPIVGAVFFVLMREFLVLNLGEYHLIVFGVMFILVVLFLPGGLMEGGERVIKAVKKLLSKRNHAGLADHEK
jgi:branched-chain amino acid transport system permease protein